MQRRTLLWTAVGPTPNFHLIAQELCYVYFLLQRTQYNT